MICYCTTAPLERTQQWWRWSRADSENIHLFVSDHHPVSGIMKLLGLKLSCRMFYTSVQTESQQEVKVNGRDRFTTTTTTTTTSAAVESPQSIWSRQQPFFILFFFIFTWGLIGGKIVSRNIICTRGDCPAASRSEETNKSSFCGHGGGQHWVLCWVFFVFAVIISSLPHLTLTGHQMLTSSRQTSAQSSETNKFKLIGMKGLCSNWSTVDFSHNKLQWYCGISKK